MKFMTPASVQNLPNYLADDRARAAARKEEDRYQKTQEEKKLMAQLGMKVMRILDSGGDVQKELAPVLDEFADKGMTPEAFQMTFNMLHKYKQDQIAQEDRQNLLDKTRQQDEAKDIVNRSLLGAGQMPYSGEGVGLSSYGVPAKDASRMGQTEQGLLNTLVDNPDAGFLMRDSQGKQAAQNLENEKWQSKKALDEAQRQKYEAEAFYNKNIRGRESGKGSSGHSDFSINDSQKIMETVYGDLMAQNGYTQTEYGVSDAKGNPVNPQETQRIQQISRHVAGDVQKMMKNGDMSYPEAIQKATQTYQKNVSAVASGIYDGIQKGSLNGFDQVPEYMQVDAVKILAQKTGQPVNKILDQIDSILATPQTTADTTTTTDENTSTIGTPPPAGGTLESLAENQIVLPGKKVYGVPVERSGNSPLSVGQSLLSKLPVYQAQKDKYPLPGETDIEMAIRMAYGEDKYNLQDRKRMAERMRKKFPEATDEQIAEAILSGGHEAGNLDDSGQHLLEK